MPTHNKLFAWGLLLVLPAAAVRGWVQHCSVTPHPWNPGEAGPYTNCCINRR